MGEVSQNFFRVQERVNKAAEHVGVSPDSISVVLVSKRIAADKVQEAASSGGRIFAENRVQEAKNKIPQIQGDNLEWHMIGRLQKNKINAALKLFSMIQSVDGVDLAKAINAAAARLGIESVDCLLQVNVAEEATKGGIESGKVFDILGEMSACAHLRVQGLMAIPPFCVEPEDSRKYFLEMRKLWDGASQLSLPNVSMEFLSMGMSHDFDIAIEEGANMVRVGTSIFGERDK